MSNILTPREIVTQSFGRVFGSYAEKHFRNGIELEKGAVLNQQRIEQNRDLYEKYCNLWSVYPDLFLDLIKPVGSQFNLYFYQRIFLRACMRYRYINVTAPRALNGAH
jgi:hypothetical protein